MPYLKLNMFAILLSQPIRHHFSAIKNPCSGRKTIQAHCYANSRNIPKTTKIAYLTATS
ncbi:hypothetical protein MCC93_19860 [Morococcus cerebrosus]|uniref:Uncharacterized protein n=1 Tax=Morococcus cerebrosus TaxID=1056807 RepID=A0A0C1GXK5_9NEIS|nr:hypothetical protein MCC93_19860 [Morococcus cerebrosus]